MNIEEWHADIAITEQLVINCLQQFPAILPVKTIELIGEGWDNKVFLINEKIIFRFPRRKIAVELIERENKVLTHLPQFPNIEIPIPQYIGHPTTDYPYPFQGYQKINGISGYQAQLTFEERDASIVPLANFLKQLHAINVTQATIIGAEAQIFDRMLVKRSIKKLTERIDKISAQKISVINQAAFQHEIDTAQKLVLPYEERCLVHGDLDCRHLLFHQQRLSGIIDWGDTGINNKAVDLAIIWNFYPSECHSIFFKIYGTVDDATWQYARFLGIYSSFTHMLYAKDIGDQQLFAEALHSIKRINAALLID